MVSAYRGICTVPRVSVPLHECFVLSSSNWMQSSKCNRAEHAEGIWCLDDAIHSTSFLSTWLNTFSVLKCLWNNYPDLLEFFADKTSKVLLQSDSTQEQQQLFLLMRSSKAREKNVIRLPYKSFPRCLLLRRICSDRKRWLWCSLCFVGEDCIWNSVSWF